MKKEVKIENKVISIYYDENSETINIPVVFLNTFDEDGQEIWNKTSTLTSKDYILVTISNVDWNKEMSPWYMEKLFKGEDDYTGHADEYLLLLTGKIILEIKKIVTETLNKNVTYYTIAGYSLAGLFAIYSLYKTDIFQRAVTCSGSLWYPGFVEFVKANEMIIHPYKIYFSLGNKEKNTKNETMAKVEESTKVIEQCLHERGINTIYEENEGNHFQDVTLRIAKGICWTLE